jgi:hypothetical protein
MGKCKLILYIIVLCAGSLTGQRFKAAAIAGINMAQIDGDDLYGFDKAGLSAGGKLSYTNDNTVDFAIEMLYSQRGSSEFLFNNHSGKRILLNYFELPVIVSIRDWYIQDKGYYKVRADCGLSYGYLFKTDAVGFNTDNYKKNDISWLLGVGLNFSKILGISLRYTSAFTNLDVNTVKETKLKSYFITLRTEINF